MKKNTTDKFLIGSWVSFYPFEIDSYEYQLDQMKEAGLNFNIFPAQFGGGMLDAETWNNVETQYEARDMYYCMNGGLKEDMLEEGVRYAKGKARCIGYHLVDEPSGAALPHVGHMVRAYREADPKRYPFVNLFPSYVGNAVMEGDYEQYCSRFVKEAGEENIEYLSHDYYPFHLNGTALGIFGDMEVIRRVAFENGRLRTHGFPQSTAWMGTRMPNIDEMRWNVYAYLAYGFKALSWFNLVCPGRSDTEGECFRDSVIYRDGTIRDKQLLKDFGKLNAEVHALGDTLMKLDTIHAYHTKAGIAGVELLPGDWMIAPVGEADFVISHMITKKGDETYIMLFNKSWEAPVTATFSISPYSGIESLTYVSPFNGNDYPVIITDGRITETFRPGEGKLYKLNGLLTRKVLPIQRNPARLILETPEVAELVGLDVSFSSDTDMKASTLQITTNKRFPEEKTLCIAFEHDPDDTAGTDKETAGFPENGRIRFDAYPGKHIRFTVHDEASWYNYGYAELRVRFKDEPETEDDTAVVEAETIRYIGVDFDALNQAIAAFEKLVEADYTTDSWRAARNFYDAALDMKNGTYPQNAVTVGAWKLMDSIRDLKLVSGNTASDMKAETPFDKKYLHLDKGIVAATVATLVGAVAGIVAGVITAMKKK
ncbi:MAG: hypothetical protein J6J01_07970 [Oscillospiraceae bacterium]|nr:hypothetical protein [Clostridia bacterium]MBP3699394.1 hypothetical protein [Oscillospiraceae bacterium]